MKPVHVQNLLVGAPPAVVLALSASRTVADPDLWGHVRFGQDILAEGVIPRVDPYAFTSDRVWVNHEWLAEVIMAAAYAAGGGVGLVILKLLVVAVSFVVLWRAVRLAGVHQPAAAALVLVATAGAFTLWQTVRPQLFSLVLFTALTALMTRVGSGKHRLLLWVPALFAVWANVHGGWLFGLGVLGMWSVASAITGSLPWRWAAGGVIASLAATLLTPYGYHLWLFLLETVRVARPDITEWRPITNNGYLLFIWGVIAAPAVLVWWRWRAAAWPLLLTSAVVGFLALRVGRLQGFFALTNVVLLAPGLAGYGPAQLRLSRPPGRRDLAVVGILCLAGFTALGVAVRKQVTCITLAGSPGYKSWEPEPEAIGFLEANSLRGRLLTYFNWGEMAIWHLAPEMRVSYDGRRETVYSPSVQEAHLRFYSKAPDPAYATAIGADYIWVPHRLAVVPMLVQRGWVELYRGDKSVVLGRSMELLREPQPWTGPRCFPGP